MTHETAVAHEATATRPATHARGVVTLEGLTRLAPVSLAELVERAALLTRVDRKYVLTHERAEEFLTTLEAPALVLEEAGLRSFGYRSEYLDTPELVSYHLAARGRRNRFKVRTRTYLETGTRFMEVKTRGPRGTTVKERVEVSAAGCGDASGAPVFVAEALGRAGIELDGPLEPVMTSEYRRATLLLTGSATRVTLDTDLSWSRPGSRLEAGVVVVETKSGSTAGPADRHLWRLGHRPARISKYGTGMSLLVPGLPANKWSAVRERHLAHLLEGGRSR